MTSQQKDVEDEKYAKVIEGHGPFKYSVSHFSKNYPISRLLGVSGLWNALADNTTIHGYPNLNHTRGRLI